MSPSSRRVETLAAYLHKLRTAKLPIDMPTIEPVLIALLEAGANDDRAREPGARD